MRAPAKVAAASVLALLFAGASDALACSCMASGPPCQAVWTADAVFAGTVRSIQEIEQEHEGTRYPSLLVRFDVERAFVNSRPGPVEILTARDGAACGYTFQTGRRYLVYAWKSDGGRVSTGICSRTRPFEDAEEDLRYLTTMPATGSGARVYGRITRWHRDPFEEVGVDYGPLEGIVVNVRGPDFSRDAVTDRHGRFDIAGLPTGKATLTVLAPPLFDQRYLKREIELKDLRACQEQDLGLMYIATVSGTVVDADGRPIAGLSIDAVADELAGHNPPPYQRPVKTDATGRFQFDDLPPGRYVFGLRLTKGYGHQPAGPPIFFPGTSTLDTALVVELKPGEQKEIGVLRLPTRDIRPKSTDGASGSGGAGSRGETYKSVIRRPGCAH
jgi:hypothetical protein